MKFKKEFLQDLLGSDDVVEDKIVDHSRWSVVHDLIFRHEGKFYYVSYSEGATEMQDESPFEYSDDETECPEVHAVKKTVTVYEAVGK
jgi:hypothetical protein